MSGPADTAAGAGREAAGAGHQPVTQSTPPAAPPSPANITLAALLLAGGLLTGTAAALVASQGSAGGASTLQVIARSDLDQAKTSMQPESAAQAAEEARQCKTPLASITVQAASGSAPQRIRIRSGTYVSPWLLLSDAPRRMAIPFPAPYLTGKGELIVEEATRPVTLWLTPPRDVGPQAGSNLIPVVWATTNPCPP